jgi:uncharacterized membrane protein YdjX (TVP38/TMEM64 family)
VFLRVASSNLSNRSMGLDTECDLAVESTDDARVAPLIARLLVRLVAEHLGVARERVARELERRGSLLATVEALRSQPPTLEPLPEETPGWLERAVPVPALIDLERPVEQAPHVELLPHDLREPAVHAAVRALRVAAVIALLLLAATWLRRLLPIAAGWLPDVSVLPVLVAAAFVVGSALMLPLSVLGAVTLILLGPWRGFGYALTGAMTAAFVGWAAGRVAWRRGLRHVAGPHAERIARRLGVRRDLRALTSVRLLPVAPFTVVSVVCGAMGVRMDRFLLGTLLGTLPSMSLLALLVYALGR